MGVGFTSKEGSALYALLANNTADIILKTDRQGFIVHASPAIEQLGVILPTMLIGPHILDLVHPSSAVAIRLEHEATIGGRPGRKWIEVPALTQERQQRWFEMQFRCLTDDNGQIYGALGVMRSIEQRRSLEERLVAAELTDSLTGLTNRKAFDAMLQHLVDQQVTGCLALLDIDHLKTINMRYGHAAGDGVLVAFANLLQDLVRPDDIISRIGGEGLAVLFPEASADQAEVVCRRLIAAVPELPCAADVKGLNLTASAGVSPIGKSLDDTVKRAALALFFAKAKGRNRVEMDNAIRFPEKAMTAN